MGLILTFLHIKRKLIYVGEFNKNYKIYVIGDSKVYHIGGYI